MNPSVKNSAPGKPERCECYGPLNFELHKNRITTINRELIFSENEFNALLFMARREGERLSFEQIYASVWVSPRCPDTPETRQAARGDIGRAAMRLTAAAGGFSWIELISGGVYVFHTNWGPGFNSELLEETRRRFGI